MNRSDQTTSPAHSKLSENKKDQVILLVNTVLKALDLFSIFKRLRESNFKNIFPIQFLDQSESL